MSRIKVDFYTGLNEVREGHMHYEKYDHIFGERSDDSQYN